MCCWVLIWDAYSSLIRHLSVSLFLRSVSFFLSARQFLGSVSNPLSVFFSFFVVYYQRANSEALFFPLAISTLQTYFWLLFFFFSATFIFHMNTLDCAVDGRTEADLAVNCCAAAGLLPVTSATVKPIKWRLKPLKQTTTSEDRENNWPHRSSAAEELNLISGFISRFWWVSKRFDEPTNTQEISLWKRMPLGLLLDWLVVYFAIKNRSSGLTNKKYTMHYF